jgi:hypothetical protein
MASISRQIGWSQESNLLYQILNQLTKLTSIMFGLKPKYKVYTALLLQSGGDDASVLTGEPGLNVLTVGVTYQIVIEDSNIDFTNVGAPNNNVETYFVATGTTPNSWGNNIGDPILSYNTGAPVVTVLENTIGNIWFTYEETGKYNLFSDELFTLNKTYSTIGLYNVTMDSYLTIRNSIQNINNERLRIYTQYTDNGYSWVDLNDILVNTPIEIRVYS